MSELSYLGYKQRCEEQQKALDEMKESLKMAVGQRNKANRLVKKLKKENKLQKIFISSVKSLLKELFGYDLNYPSSDIERDLVSKMHDNLEAEYNKGYNNRYLLNIGKKD